MNISRIDHLVLTVKHIDATVEFYSRVMRMKLVTFKGGRKDLSFGSQKINLHEAGNARWKRIGNEALVPLLYDPQTSGGLLLSVDRSQAAPLLEKVQRSLSFFFLD